MSLNSKYLAALAKYPLLTKSVTAAVLAALNELLASAIAGDIKTTKLQIRSRSFNIRHVISTKTAQMVVYGALIATPISHVLYKILYWLFRGKTTARSKALQTAVAITTISPLLSAIYVSWLLLINSNLLDSRDVKSRLLKVEAAIRRGLKSSFWAVYRTSAVTSVVAITAAQNFVPQDLWVSFFSLVYFIVGSVQNTRFKLRFRKEQRGLLKKDDDIKETEELS